jgi:DNA-binding beta-propeller fold protein YncE
VTDRFNDNVQKFSADGKFITKWGSKGSADGQFNEPLKSAIDISGNLYVSDMNNYRIQKFSADGKFITKWGSRGYNEGQFIRPLGIDIDSNNSVYVIDQGISTSIFQRW